MKKISGIQAMPSQKFNFPLDDGTVIYFNLNYRPSIQMWFIDITYLTKIINGLRLCAAFNLLNQWNKILPFGLYVNCQNSVDPFLIDDFSNGRCTLNILTQDEVKALLAAYGTLKNG
jgi:hypothetical protein